MNPEIATKDESAFRSVLFSVWLRLMCLGIVGLAFSLMLYLATDRIQGWTFYLTTSEIVFEVVVRMILAAIAGMILGTVVTALLAPFLFGPSRQAVARWASQIAVVLAVFGMARVALMSLITWSYTVVPHRAIFDTALTYGFLIAFLVSLLIPRARKEVLDSMDFLFDSRISRRIVVITLLIALALVAGEFAFSRPSNAVKASTLSEHPKSNILLVTFDAMSAEDVSFYGYGLATTPNIDAFARSSTAFDHFYSASTFTTPSIAAIMTGLYPSESHVHQLQGQVPGSVAGKNLAHVLREGGYVTGAFISNPYPHYYVASWKDFDVLPEPEFRQGGLRYLWALTSPLHQNSGIGSRIDEYVDLERSWDLFSDLAHNQSLRFRPTASFDQAQRVLSKLPDGFFLWIHVMAPHDPYLPDAADRGRFLPESELRTFEKDGRRFQPTYPPDQQGLISRRRLAYDEYVSSADRAFGEFMAKFEKDGKLSNTTVIVSADHGESFEGGTYRHETPYLTRPVIHVPLMIRSPGQREGRRVAVTADQTSLAPTIVELAGLRPPEWMHGSSLAGKLDGADLGQGEGQAFTQFLEKNSIFRPSRHGSVGIIDAHYEYVLDLDTQKGSLRPLDQAQVWNLDRTTDNPPQAAAMRAAIFARFPELKF